MSDISFDALKTHLFQLLDEHEKKHPPLLKDQKEKEAWIALREYINKSQDKSCLFKLLKKRFKKDVIKKLWQFADKQKKNCDLIRERLRKSLSYEDLISKLEDVFSSKQFTRQFNHQNMLQDDIARCIVNYDVVYHEAVKIFGEPFDPTPYISPKPAFSTYKEGKEKLVYSFDDCINSAIDKYLEEKSNIVSIERAQNIEKIKLYLKDTQLPVEERLKKIEDYIHSSDFHKSFNSDLKNYVCDGLSYFKKMLDACKSFDEHIRNAMNRYLKEKGNSLSENRKGNIQRLCALLNDTTEFNPHDRLQKLKAYFRSDEFKPKFRSTLRKYVMDAAHYAASLSPAYQFDQDSKEHVTHLVPTRLWPSTTPQSDTIVIGVPGWTDSVESWKYLASLVQKNGMDFISYDTLGHGNNDRFNGLFKNDVPADMLRIEFRAFAKKIAAQYKNVIFVGHSLGGAILATEHAFIENEFKQKVKNVTLLAPAVSETIFNLANVTRLIHPSMPPERSAQYYRYSEPAENAPPPTESGKSERRMGSRNFSLWSLLPFMRRAYKALERLFSDKNKKKETVSEVEWDILYGNRDRYLIHQELNKLKIQFEEKTKTPQGASYSFRMFNEQDHWLPWTRYRNKILGSLIEKFRNAIKSPEPVSTPSSSLQRPQ